MHKLTINGSTSTQIKLGRYTTVLNLRKALQEVGYNVKVKACLIKQTHSSMPARARDNYVIQYGDEIEFTNVPPKIGARKERGSGTTVTVGRNTFTFNDGVLIICRL